MVSKASVMETWRESESTYERVYRYIYTICIYISRSKKESEIVKREENEMEIVIKCIVRDKEAAIL